MFWGMMDAAADLEAELKCAVCLSIYRDPVQLACGHNLCSSCLSHLWENRSSCSCPECRAAVVRCLPPQRNLKLTNIVERFRATMKSSTSTDITQGPHIIAEDGNLRTSEEVPALVSGCPEHREPWEFFCRQDKVCLCRVCWESHQHHSWQSLDRASADGRAVLQEEAARLQQAQNMLQDTMERLQDIQTQLRADRARLKEQVAGIFTNIRETVTAQERRVLDYVEAEENIQWSRLTERLGDMQSKRESLHQLLAEAQVLGNSRIPDWEFMNLYQKGMERLLKADVYIQSFTVHKRELDRPSVNQIEKECQVALKRISRMLEDKISQSQEVLLKCQAPVRGQAQKLKTQPACSGTRDARLTLDPNTAHYNLSISPDLLCAEWVEQRQPCPAHPERFRLHPQVLCSQGFTSGRHCWRVCLTGTRRWEVGATCKGRDLSWVDSCIAWALRWDGCRLQAFEGHTRHSSPLLGSVHQAPGSIRVCLDCDGGTLSFFANPDKAMLGRESETLLHTFRIKLQGPVFPGFYLEHSKVSIV